MKALMNSCIVVLVNAQRVAQNFLVSMYRESLVQFNHQVEGPNRRPFDR